MDYVWKWPVTVTVWKVHSQAAWTERLSGAQMMRGQMTACAQPCDIMIASKVISEAECHLIYTVSGFVWSNAK